MGSGAWRHEDFVAYSRSSGRRMRDDGAVDMSDFSGAQEVFKSRRLHRDLDPKNIVRECRDTEEHPETVPVILALDVTGSMGSSAMEVAKMLSVIMTRLYQEVRDVEFCVMGIGDLAYDDAPIQMSQYESDIRIAEHLDKVFFEGGGGGNSFESYTAAWYMAARHTKLDCRGRGKKGLIITLGDEPCNPYLPRKPLAGATGDALQDDVRSRDLYAEASEGFDIFHIHVEHDSGSRSRTKEARAAFTQYLADERFMTAGLEEISDKVVAIVKDFAASNADEPASTGGVTRNKDGYITW